MNNGITQDEANSIANFIEEINKMEYWIMSGIDSILYDTFVSIEYKYFEGYNVPIKADERGQPLEDFTISYNRVKKFIELKHKVITP